MWHDFCRSQASKGGQARARVRSQALLRVGNIRVCLTRRERETQVSVEKYLLPGPHVMGWDHSVGYVGCST